MDKVFIVMIHDKETRPYIHGVCATRKEAEESCLRLNHGFNGNGMFADFISEIVQNMSKNLYFNVETNELYTESELRNLYEKFKEDWSETEKEIYSDFDYWLQF